MNASNEADFPMHLFGILSVTLFLKRQTADRAELLLLRQFMRDDLGRKLIVVSSAMAFGSRLLPSIAPRIGGRRRTIRIFLLPFVSFVGRVFALVALAPKYLLLQP